VKKYHNTTEIALGDGAKLKDFDWWLKEFRHDYETGISHGTVIFQSGGFEDSRPYAIANPATYKEQALLIELLKLPEFTGSNPI